MNNDLDNLSFQFFKLFAQYEYALKATGFGKAGNKRLAEPNWDRFAIEIGVRVLSVEETEVQKARRYLFELPPKRQIWVNNAVQWEEVPNNDRSVQMLFSHIRRVRNNLYHGGKFGSRWIAPGRSQELLFNSLVILRALIPLDSNLFEAIHGAA